MFVGILQGAASDARNHDGYSDTIDPQTYQGTAARSAEVESDDEDDDEEEEEVCYPLNPLYIIVDIYIHEIMSYYNIYNKFYVLTQVSRYSLPL